MSLEEPCPCGYRPLPCRLRNCTHLSPGQTDPHPGEKERQLRAVSAKTARRRAPPCRWRNPALEHVKQPYPHRGRTTVSVREPRRPATACGAPTMPRMIASIPIRRHRALLGRRNRVAGGIRRGLTRRRGVPEASSLPAAPRTVSVREPERPATAAGRAQHASNDRFGPRTHAHELLSRRSRVAGGTATAGAPPGNGG